MEVIHWEMVIEVTEDLTSKKKKKKKKKNFTKINPEKPENILEVLYNGVKRSKGMRGW